MPYSSLRILLVEDNEAARTAMARILLLLKAARVTAVGTVAEGLAALDDDPPPDCIMADLNLPDGDGGCVLAEAMRRGMPAKRVLATATPFGARVEELRKSCAEAVLTKPVDLEELAEVFGIESD